MFFDQLCWWWKILKRAAVVIGVVLCFFTLIEVLRAYQTLSTLHPLAGYAFLLVSAVLIVWAIGSLYGQWRSLPKVLVAPAKTNISKYSRYLIRYLARLEQNQLLDDNARQLTRQGRDHLQSAFQNQSDQTTLESAIETAEQQYIEPVLKQLDAQADKKIRSGVRDIMLAVTLSPYRSVDLLVVIYRNLSMVQNIALVYNSRPRLRESFAILYDTARVVATVNFVNLGSKMLDNFTQGLPGMIPGVGRIIDDCAEGLAAGILTSLTGHAAKDRCRAFRKWNFAQAQTNIATHLKTFTADVGMMFFKDIIPLIRIPGGIAVEKWKQLTDSISRGFSQTVDAIHQFVRGKSAPNPKETP